jgi:hypothetical protein
MAHPAQRTDMRSVPTTRERCGKVKRRVGVDQSAQLPAGVTQRDLDGALETHVPAGIPGRGAGFTIE